MARVKLTAGRVRDFACPADKAQAFLWDTEAPGLAVRATPSGAKAFIFQAKLGRKDVRLTIGPCASWAITSDDPEWPGAREHARQLQTLIDRGLDPRQVKAGNIAAAEAKREEERRQDAPALAVWGEYLEARRGKWSARHLADHEAMTHEGGKVRTRGRRPGESGETLPGILRPLLLVPLAQIDAERVRQWMREEAPSRPTQARLALGLLRAFLNWCHDRPDCREHVHTDACTARLAREELPKKQV